MHIMWCLDICTQIGNDHTCWMRSQAKVDLDGAFNTKILELYLGHIWPSLNFPNELNYNWQNQAVVTYKILLKIFFNANLKLSKYAYTFFSKT